MGLLPDSTFLSLMAWSSQSNAWILLDLQAWVRQPKMATLVFEVWNCCLLELSVLDSCRVLLET